MRPLDHARASRREAHGRAIPPPGFRPDIEGLRAVAVLAVVLFHAEVPGVGGGFVGVDVFFVISGFLITGLLWADVAATGTVRLGRFYGARARRLLPAAATVGVVTAVGAAILLPPLSSRGVLGDGIASALYVGNYRFAIVGTDYLASDTAPSPFQHYWSLGVEEQFYLLWPALILGTAWHLRRQLGTQAATSTRPYLLALGLVAAASLALSLTWTRTSPPWAFFSLPTRAWELAAGGLVALSAERWRRLPGPCAAVAGWGGLGLVVLSCVQLGPTTAYPGTAALLPVLGTALVLGAGGPNPAAGVGRALSVPSLRAVGRLSYSWYLWHWPVLVLAPVALGHPLGLGGRVAAAGVAAGLAALTLHLIENPARFAAPLRRSPARSLAVGAAAVAVLAGTALVLQVLVPVPAGHGAAAPVVAAAPGADAAPRSPTAQIQAAVTSSAAPRSVPSNLSPPLADAAADKPAVFVDGCLRSWLDVGHGECASGDPASPTRVVLVGDSHAAMWDPALQSVAERRGWRLETLTKVTCPLLDLPIVSPYLGRPYRECEQWRAEMMARLAAEHPQLVVLTMSRRYAPDFSFASYDPAWLDALTRTVAALRGLGASVLVLGPVPDPQTAVPACLSAHLDDASACAPTPSAAVNQAGIDAERAATTAGGGHYADLTSLFCTAEVCPVIVGDKLVFRDDNHLTGQYAATLGPAIGELVDSARAAN
ncbi:acyltransferase [Mycobacterium eburneum]|nr:acyltransferase [Mycobacterium eburneum]